MRPQLSTLGLIYGASRNLCEHKSVPESYPLEISDQPSIVMDLSLLIGCYKDKGKGVEWSASWIGGVLSAERYYLEKKGCCGNVCADHRKGI